MDEGADIEARNEYGKMPLHFAAEFSNARVVRVLIDLGADVNALSENGSTALHFATKRCNVEIVRTLLAAGADANAINSRGLTPLHHAAIWGTVKMVRLLIDSGSDARIVDTDGLKPLEYAAERVREILEAETGMVGETPCLAKDEKNIMLYWDDAHAPPDVTRVVDKWQALCPTWNVTLFNQDTAFRFIRDEMGEEIAKLFYVCGLPAMRSDFFRVFWGIINGGIYSDITFAPKREPLFFDAGKNITLIRHGHGRIKNGIFFAKKGCKELKLIGYEILHSVAQRKTGSIISITGPSVWGKILGQRETSTIAIVDSGYMWKNFIERSNYISSMRGTDKHWTQMQWRTGIYRQP